MPCFDFILETLLFGEQAKVQRAALKLISSSIVLFESEVARAWLCEPASTACLQKLWDYCVNHLVVSWFRTLRMYRNQLILWICVSADNSRLSDLSDLSSWMRTECNTGCYQDVFSVCHIFVILILHARRLDHYHSCYSFAMFQQNPHWGVLYESECHSV